MFGFAVVDLHVPEEKREYFEEMTPIFKNTVVTLDDVGEHMRDFANRNNLGNISRRALIGSMFADKLMLSTPLIKWYWNIG